MNNIFFLLGFVLCFLTVSPDTLFAQSLDHKQGELLVKLKPNQEIDSFLESFESRHFQSKIFDAKPLVKALNIWQFNFDFTIHKAESLKRKLWQDQTVEQIQYNHFVNSRAVPNDELFDEQWHHLNLLLNGNPEADLDSDLAWDISTGGLTPQGDTIVIAVIDNGIASGHPDLKDRIWINHNEIPFNGIDDDQNGYVDDHLGYNTIEENGNIQGTANHGTSVAGIIGATGNNDEGVTGINWDSKLMIIKNDFNTTEANVLIAYGYAFTMRNKYNLSLGNEGAFVVATNASWGRNFGQAEDAPLWCSFYDRLGEVGIVNCAATANLDINVDQQGDLPTSCSSDFLVSVTNLNQFGEKVRNAAFGANSIDLGAFGDGVFTTQLNGYGAFSGTSAATPNVAGLVGLLYAAPCDNLTCIAKNDPKEAANFVVGYLLDGTKANGSLRGITKTEGQLNLFNSLTDMMNDCFECSLPSSVSELEVDQGTGTFSWTAFNSSLAVNLQYRKVGESIFNTVLNVTPPFTLTGLEPCTNYDFQLESICGDTTSNHTNLSQFNTSGCCENPNEFMVVSNTETEVQLFWEKAALVNSYSGRYKDLRDETWINLEDVEEGFVTISGLEPCTEYEFQVKANCSQTDVPDYTSSFNFASTGCGNCIEGNYCQVEAGSTVSEWIEQILINGIEINSGNNEGYIMHDDIAITLAEGGNFALEVHPGYANQELPEIINVWIDLNQNSIFEEEERLLSSPVVREDWTTRIEIPAGNSGLTRMRVMMSWVENEYNPDLLLPCEAVLFGEVEDICISIVPSQETCAEEVGQIRLVTSDMNSAILSWDVLNDANEYKIFYREFGSPEFATFYATQNQIIINGLETCLRYEVQVAALCSGFATEPSESFFFDTECVPLSTGSQDVDIGAIVFPSPFKEQITVQLTAPFEVLSAQLFSPSGLELGLGDIEYKGSEIRLNNLGSLASGLYILKLNSKRDSKVFKLVKG